MRLEWIGVAGSVAVAGLVVFTLLTIGPAKATGLVRSAGTVVCCVTLEKQRNVLLENDKTVSLAQISQDAASSFVWSAERQANGSILLDGMVPSRASQIAILSMAGDRAVDATSIVDAPVADFQEHVQKGLRLLSVLEAGTVRFANGTWQVTGKFAEPTTAEWRDAVTFRSELVAEGWILQLNGSVITSDTQIGQGASAVEPVSGKAAATAVPFLWSAVRSAGGRFLFSGSVPDQDLKDYFQSRFGNTLDDKSVIAEGAPDTFAIDARRGIAALALMRRGRLAYTGSTWALIGEVRSDDQMAAIEKLFSAAGDNGKWHLEIGVLADPMENADTSAADVSEPEEGVANKPEIVAETPKVVAEKNDLSKTGKVLEKPSADADETALLDAEPSSGQADGAGTVGTKTVENAVAPNEVDVAISEVPDAVEKVSFSFVARKFFGGKTLFAGQVPSETMRLSYGAMAGASTNDLMVAEGAPLDFNQNALLGLMALDAASSGILKFNDGLWSMQAAVNDPRSKDNVARTLDQVRNSKSWTVEISAPTPLQFCQTVLSAFFAEQTISFRPASARIADESLASLDELASDLKACPEATINIEGHTDSDGPEAENLTLSVERAETVADAFTDRGVNPARLYAIGYGETLPIAPNTTAAGKSQNRRIVITALERQ